MANFWNDLITGTTASGVCAYVGGYALQFFDTPYEVKQAQMAANIGDFAAALFAIKDADYLAGVYRMMGGTLNTAIAMALHYNFEFPLITSYAASTMISIAAIELLYNTVENQLGLR